MRRDSSARRSSTMVAVSVAAVVIPMVLGMLLLPGADAAAQKCPAHDSAVTNCAHDVKEGDTFEIDCTSTKDTVIPTDLLSTTTSSIKVCKSETARINATDTCTGEALEGMDGVGTVTSISNGWRAAYTGVKGDKDVIINGSCRKTGGTNGYYFNFVLKATTTTKAPGDSGAMSAFGLATASSVALLGLVVAAA